LLRGFIAGEDLYEPCDRPVEMPYPQRLADVKQLQANGYLTIENNGATVTLGHGKRTRALVASFREHWGESGKQP
jgi:hypothetical protein